MRGWTRLDSSNACITLDDNTYVTTHVEPALTLCVTVVARQGRCAATTKFPGTCSMKSAIARPAAAAKEQRARSNESSLGGEWDVKRGVKSSLVFTIGMTVQILFTPLHSITSQHIYCSLPICTLPALHHKPSPGPADELLCQQDKPLVAVSTLIPHQAND
ncbi:hypothetical protein HaLaN_01790 [Haematococcus lacustris]|uniref:Uncharacterized protein n=1 Tax=Haematococcus lacustris TaxID=44745 RepID=A0A699YJ67_HAELA|nr:hypothetical protein HaLaN_01790 [Haematococcus lacustris]